MNKGCSRNWFQGMGFAVMVAVIVLTGGEARAQLTVTGPLPGLSAEQIQAFQDGKARFVTDETPATGLGPVYNEASCVRCHAVPGPGGSGIALVTKIGRILPNGVVEGLPGLGGPVIQGRGIGQVAPGVFIGGEMVPKQANIVARRRVPNILGMGLVEAIADQMIQAEADRQARFSPTTAGRVSVVIDARTGSQRIGRFGWKAEAGSLYDKTLDALKEQLGITTAGFVVTDPVSGQPVVNPFQAGLDKRFDEENAPGGNGSLLAFDPVPGPDRMDDADVRKLVDFQSLLAPAPRGSSSLNVVAGEALFKQFGCVNCHTPSWRTAADHQVAALRNKTIQPYSDFLLHDMGTLGDGLPEGSATGREFRTAPLWGLRFQKSFLHDGRARTVDSAVLMHDGQGRMAANVFSRASIDQKRKLIDFLNSL